MFSTLRARLVGLNLCVVFLVAAGLLLYLVATQPGPNELVVLLVVTALIGAGLSVGLTLLLSASITRPLRELTSSVQRVAKGDLSARVLPSSQDEIGRLTLAVNNMAEAMQGQMTALAEERGRLSKVLESMADGLLILDASGRVTSLNPAAARLLKTTTAHAAGRTLAQVVRDHRLIQLWQQCQKEGQEVSDLIDVPPDGLSLRVVVTQFQQAAVIGYLLFLQDLTQLRRLESARRDFMSNISHELRTPLASLRALVDTLRDGALDDPPAAARFLNRIDAEVDALTQMVQELLELSRIDSGRVPFRLKPVPVANLVQPSVERLRAQAERAAVTLSVAVPAHLPPVLADLERIQQVVTNLTHNAIKFTPPGGSVTVVAYTNPVPPATAYLIGAEQLARSMVAVEVRDTGVGIPGPDLSRIFERFYKSDRARSGGGTGLGLAIAKHIVLAHSGTIWVTSREGSGSAFAFAIPSALPDDG